MREIRIAKNIQQLRRQRGYASANELTSALCQIGYFCSLSTVKSWEADRRRPPLDAISALCALLGVTADDLIFG